MRDNYSDFLPVSTLTPAVRTTAATGASVSRAGYESVTHFAHVGDDGVTFDGTNYLDLIMEDSPDDSTWSLVAAKDVLGEPDTMPASGVVKRLNAAHATPTVYAFGYVGSKKFSRLRLDFVGAHGTGTATAANALLGGANTTPTISTAVAG